MLPGEYSDHLLATYPQGVLDLGRIDNDIPALGLAPAAEHQRIGERPRLAGEIAHVANVDPGFLEDLPPHGCFERLTRFDESRQKRIHALRPTWRAAEKDVIAVNDQHDDDRIGSREMFRTASRAIPLPAARRKTARRPAGSAKPVRSVPVHQPTRRRGELALEWREPCHQATQLGKDRRFASFGMALFGCVEERVEPHVASCFRHPIREIGREEVCPVPLPQKDPVRACILHRRMIGADLHESAIVMQRLSFPEEEESRIRFIFQRPCFRTQLRRAIERTTTEDNHL